MQHAVSIDLTCCCLTTWEKCAVGFQAGEAQLALLTALQQYQDKAAKQRKGRFSGHLDADEMHYSLASLAVMTSSAAQCQGCRDQEFHNWYGCSSLKHVSKVTTHLHFRTCWCSPTCTRVTRTGRTTSGSGPGRSTRRRRCCAKRCVLPEAVHPQDLRRTHSAFETMDVDGGSHDQKEWPLSLPSRLLSSVPPDALGVSATAGARV